MSDTTDTKRAEGSPPFSHPHAAWLWLAAYFLFNTGTAFFKLPLATPKGLILLAYGVSTAAYMLLALAMLAALAAYLNTPSRALVGVGIGLGAWFLFDWVLR